MYGNFARRLVARETLKTMNRKERYVCCSVDKPVLLMLSLDGFGAEYLSRNVTPTLQALRDCGVTARYMRPAFPTGSFVNHYSMATVSCFY